MNRPWEEVVNDSTARRGVLDSLNKQWEYFDVEINDRIGRLKDEMHKDKAKSYLDESVKSLKIAVRNNILADDQYKEKESLYNTSGVVPANFKNTVIAVHEALKSFFSAYIEEEQQWKYFRAIPRNSNLGKYFDFFYDGMLVKRQPELVSLSYNVRRRHGLDQEYAGITQLIYDLRNIMAHDDEKPSYLLNTGIYNNVFTVTALLTLTIPALLEMITLWEESIVVTESHKAAKP